MRNTNTHIFCNYCEQKTTHICKGEHIDYTEDEYSRCRLYICSDCRTGVLEVFCTDRERCEYNRYDYDHLEDYFEDELEHEVPGEWLYFPKRATEYVSKHIHCNTCEQETKHICKGEHIDENEYECYQYRFYICTECEIGVLELFYTNRDIFPPYGTVDEEEYTGELSYTPERNQFHHKQKEFRTLLFSKIGFMYNEVVKAFNMNMPILCAIGIRALLEGICADKNITGRNLKEKIDGLNTRVGQNIADNLHSIRFLGNEAAHELVTPSKKEALLAIEICEGLLTYLYELERDLDHKTTSLKRMFDMRKNQPQSGRWGRNNGWNET